MIESPSPLDDPVDFAKWQDGYLAVVDDFLVNFTGPFIESGTPFDYTPADGYFAFDPVNVEPIASYKYTWLAPDGTEKTIITKTFPIRDKVSGKKGSISLTYSVDDWITYDNAFGAVGEYGNATGEVRIRFIITNSGRFGKYTLFLKEFLPADGGKALIMLVDFGHGKGIDPDLNKQRFVFGGYK